MNETKGSMEKYLASIEFTPTF